MQYKTCCRCKEKKEVSEFFKESKTKDGLQGECKKCASKRISKHQAFKNAKNPEYKKKKFAHNRLNEAIKRGDIVKNKKCSRCGKPGKTICHHTDYEKPYTFIELCRSCHVEIHKLYY